VCEIVNEPSREVPSAENLLGSSSNSGAPSKPFWMYQTLWFCSHHSWLRRTIRRAASAHVLRVVVELHQAIFDRSAIGI
jgi:hypothetical protein